MVLTTALIGAASFAGLKWWLSRPRRRVYVVNHEDYFYEIRVIQDGTINEVTLPCQHLPWLLRLMERCRKDKPIDLHFVSHGGPEHDKRMTVPPWANRTLYKQLRRLARTWQPRWIDRPAEGPYR